MRLIDADALSKKLCKTTVFIKGGEIFQRMINEAPTIEPDGDLISRSRAIKDVSEWATDILHPDRLIKEDAIHILESLPSATSQNLTKPNKTSEDDLISRADAIALVIKAIHGTDNKEIKEYLFDGLRKQMWSLPSAESTGAMDEAIQKYIEDGYMQPIGEDLISRQAAIEELERIMRDHPLQGYEDEQLLINAVESLPPAPDSRQRGEWKGYNADKGDDWLRDDGTPIFLVCDKCYGTVINNGSAHWNYCPNCGADMRGEDDDKKKYL